MAYGDMLSPCSFAVQTAVDLRADVVEVNPAMAAYIRQHYEFTNRQRLIRLANVRRLALEMAAGTFVAGTPIYMCVLPDRSAVLVNGNHTLEAIISSQKTISLTIIQKQVPDRDAAGLIYSKLDLQRTRTWADTARAVGGEFPMGPLFLSAIGTIQSHFGSTTSDPLFQSREERIRLADVYRDAGEVIEHALHGGTARGLRVVRMVGILGVAIATAHDQPQAALKFWNDVARDEGLVTGDPAKALLRSLDTATYQSKGGQMRIKMMAASAMLAWNAAFTGRQVAFIKPSTVRDFRLNGTDISYPEWIRPSVA